MRISVILPTYNEKDSILTMLSQIIAYVDKLEEIIVVDDNSPDKTWEIVQSFKDSRVKCIRRLNERGLASALAAGINTAKGDIIVWMDSDLSMPPNKIPALIAALNEADIAVGSRYITGGRDQRPPTRVLTSRIINLFANLILNFRVRDYDSGFIAVKKYVFSSVPLSTKGYGEYCIDFLYRSGKRGYKIKEIPYTFIDRKFGESKTAGNIFQLISRGIQYSIKVIKVRLDV